MKKDVIPDASAEAERLLERFFRSGPEHYFIFRAMKPLAKFLDGVSRHEISALARWGKKLAASIREAQEREGG